MLLLFLLLNSTFFAISNSQNPLTEMRDAIQYELAVNNIENYSSYIEEIQNIDTKSQVSIFQTDDDFTEKNREKTADDFAGLEEIELTLENFNGFENATVSTITTLFVLLIVFYSISILLMEEVQLFPLVRTTEKGGVSYMAGKLCAIAIITIVANLLMWGNTLLLSIIKYGSIDFNASIQSFPSYYGTNLMVTAGEMFLLLFTSKIVITFFIATILYFIVMKTVQMQKILIIIGGIGLFQFFILQLEGSSTLFVLLRNLNLINLLSPQSYYEGYYNVNLLGAPVNILVLSVVFVVGGTVIFTVLNLKTFHGEVKPQKKRSGKAKKSSDRNHSLLYHEIYKFFIVNKGVLIMAVLVVMIGIRYESTSIGLSKDEQYYQQYIQLYEGVITDGTLKKIEIEEELILQYKEELQQLSIKYENGEIGAREVQDISTAIIAKLEAEPGFLRVKEQVDFLVKNVKNPVLVEELGYLEVANKTYNGKFQDALSFSMYIVFAILFFIPYFTYEYSSGVVKIARCYLKGRMVSLRMKMGIVMVIHTILYIGIWMPIFYKQMDIFHLYEGSISASNITGYGKVLASFTLEQAMVLTYVIRYMLGLAATTLMCYFACRLQNIVKACFAAIVVFLLPICIYLLWLSL